jgi:AraC-like DNA-binding protein
MFDEYLHLNSSGHFINQPDHFCERARPMDYLFIWVLAGKGFAETENHRANVRPGHLLTFRPGKPHAYGSDKTDPWDIVWVHFTGSLAVKFFRATRRIGQPHIELGLDAELRDRWLELVIAHSAHRAEFAVRCDTGLCALLGLILHRLQQRARSTATTTPLDTHRLQSFIHEHLAEPISVEQLAREASLSVPHFNRLFKQQFAVSPIYYVIQKRVALACSLLSETAMPLKQVAETVGYDDPFYFSRLFRKMTGISPSEYRKQKQS